MYQLHNATRTWTILICLCLPWETTPSTAQEKKTPQYTPAQMAADLDQLDKALRTKWAYLDDKTKNLGLKYEQLLADAQKKTKKKLTGHEFATVLKKFVSGLGDGHSYVDTSEYRHKFYRIPVKLKRVTEGVVVADFVDDPALTIKGGPLKKGMLVKSINGEPIEELISTEGQLVSWSTQGMRDRLALIEVLHQRKKTVELVLVSESGEEKRVTTQNLIRSDKRLAFERTDNWELRFLEKDIAVFRIAKFSIPSWKEWMNTPVKDRDAVTEKTRQLITDRFSELNRKEVKSLIIDLRGNGGGTDVLGIHVAKHLVPKTFKYYLLSARYQGKWFKASGHNYRQIKTRKARWRGRLYLLVDAGCFSTTDNFIRCLTTSLPDVVVIGQPTGGGTGAPRQIVELTNCRAKVRCCTIRVLDPNQKMIEGRGSRPTHQVEPSRRAVIDNIDEELKMAMKLIKQQTSTLENAKQ